MRNTIKERFPSITAIKPLILFVVILSLSCLAIYTDIRPIQLEKLLNQATNEVHGGHLAEAVTIYRQALELTDSMEMAGAKGLICERLSELYLELYNFKAALDYCDRALRINESEKGNSGKYAEMLIKRGNILAFMGQLYKAIENDKYVLTILSPFRDKELEAETYLNLGVFYRRLGEYQQSIDCYDRVSIIAGASDNFELRLSSEINMGMLYEELGDSTEALRYYREALNRASEEGNSENHATVLFNMATLYANFGNYPEAVDKLDRATKIEHNNRHLMALIALTKGEVLLEQSRTGLAVTSYKEHLNSIVRPAKRKDPYRKAIDFVIWGRLYTLQGKHRKALLQYDSAIEVLKSNAIMDVDVISRVLFGKGECLENLDQLHEALACYQKLAYLIELSRGIINADHHRQTYFAHKLRAYEYVVKVLHKLTLENEGSRNQRVEPGNSYEATAFRYMNLSRSRSLAETMKRGMRIGVDTDSQRLSEEARTSASGRRTHPKERVAGLGNTGEELWDVLDRVVADARSCSVNSAGGIIDGYSTASIPAFLDAPSIESLYLHDELLIEYEVTDSATYAILVYSDSILCFHKILVSRDLLTLKVEGLRSSLIRKPGVAGFDVELGHELYNILVKPVSYLIPERSDLVVIPDEMLWLIPFEVLVVDTIQSDSSAAGLFPFSELNYVDYLGDTHSISYYHSAQVLASNRSRNKPNKNWRSVLLAIGDPVINDNDGRLELIRYNDANVNCSVDKPPGDRSDIQLSQLQRLTGANDEILSLGRIFGEPPRSEHLLLGVDAKEGTLKSRNLTEYKYIHVATHTISGNVAPYLGEPSLLFTQFGDSADGFLTVSEISKLDLNADLVTLSACKSQLGELVKGEGLIGLSRAFILAGASSVVASLWDVDDKLTSTFMKRFYWNLARGFNKAEALRESRTWIRRESFLVDDQFGIVTRNVHPYFWSAFVLLGEHQ